MRRIAWLVAGLVSVGLWACSSDGSSDAPSAQTTGAEAGVDGDVDAFVDPGKGDPVDAPIDGLAPEWLSEFNDGDFLFGIPFREYDGLGPLYIRQSCAACHKSALRGPGLVQKMVVVQADGITPAADQSKLPFGHTVRPQVVVVAQADGGSVTPILPPPNDPTVKVSVRIGPNVVGRGYVEAVADSEITAQAAKQAARSDGIHGRVNRLAYGSQPNPDKRFHNYQPGDMVIGRFGLKARVPTLDDFTADALQGDMGLTSPMRPTELANPDGLTDDFKPGIDIDIDAVNTRAAYQRVIAIPRRVTPDPKAVALFDQVKCSACHVPTMHTRADYPIAQLANIDAPIFSDILLHDMGDALADGMAFEGQAGPRDWRTTPLIAMRFLTQFMHDGRAATLRDAIVAHDGNGSEAHGSVALFSALSPGDQEILLRYVGSL